MKKMGNDKGNVSHRLFFMGYGFELRVFELWVQCTLEENSAGQPPGGCRPYA